MPVAHAIVKGAEREVSTFNRNTLVKVLEILDSSHAQEALAAAKLASALVREASHERSRHVVMPLRL